MPFLSGIKRRIWLCKNFLSACLAAATGRQKIFLMSTPCHGNLGDQAIILAEYQVLAKVFPGCQIVEVPTEVICSVMMRLNWRLPMQSDCMIALPGGGNLGSLYPMEEAVHRWIIESYKGHKIFFCPQSVFFENGEIGSYELRKSQMAYAKAPQLHILERDKISFAKGKEYFPHNHHMLVPDTVTAMELPPALHANKRQGVCFFLRRDKEKVLPDEVVARLKHYLEKKGIQYEFSDTVIPERLDNNTARWKAVTQKLQMAQDARLVITDRYHGTIFSVITNTPVVAFRSYDTKITAGIQWFKDLPWVHYAENMDVEQIIMFISHYCTGEEISVNKHSECAGKVIEAVRGVKEW